MITETLKDGFLPLKDVCPEFLTEQENGQSGGRPILKAGQEIIVQAIREAVGNKALLTSYISLPGRYLVFFPARPRAASPAKWKTRKTGKDQASCNRLKSRRIWDLSCGQPGITERNRKYPVTISISFVSGKKSIKKQKAFTNLL